MSTFLLYCRRQHDDMCEHDLEVLEQVFRDALIFITEKFVELVPNMYEGEYPIEQGMNWVGDVMTTRLIVLAWLFGWRHHNDLLFGCSDDVLMHIEPPFLSGNMDAEMTQTWFERFDLVEAIKYLIQTNHLDQDFFDMSELYSIWNYLDWVRFERLMNAFYYLEEQEVFNNMEAPNDNENITMFNDQNIPLVDITEEEIFELEILLGMHPPQLAPQSNH